MLASIWKSELVILHSSLGCCGTWVGWSARQAYTTFTTLEYARPLFCSGFILCLTPACRGALMLVNRAHLHGRKIPPYTVWVWFTAFYASFSVVGCLGGGSGFDALLKDLPRTF